MRVIVGKKFNKYMSDILEYYKSSKIYGLGRYGQHQYFNIDDCIKEVNKFWENKK